MEEPKNNFSQRRLHHRFYIQKEVSFQITTKPNSNIIYNGNTNDISVGGICLITEFEIKKDDLLTLKIRINNHQNCYIKLARVVYVLAFNDMFRAGVVFDMIDTKNYKLIENYLKTLPENMQSFFLKPFDTL